MINKTNSPNSQKSYESIWVNIDIYSICTIYSHIISEILNWWSVILFSNNFTKDKNQIYIYIPLSNIVNSNWYWTHVYQLSLSSVILFSSFLWPQILCAININNPQIPFPCAVNERKENPLDPLLVLRERSNWTRERRQTRRGSVRKREREGCRQSEVALQSEGDFCFA